MTLEYSLGTSTRQCIILTFRFTIHTSNLNHVSKICFKAAIYTTSILVDHHTSARGDATTIYNIV